MITREAHTGDIDAITEIYNHAVLYTTATFDTEPKTAADRKEWLEQHGDRYPVLVAIENGQVIGWASLNRWSDRPAYDLTAEGSLYIHPAYQGKGVGRALFNAIIEAGRAAGLHCILARITEGNEKSIHLSREFGFEHVGVLREVGTKFGQLLDVHMLQFIYR